MPSRADARRRRPSVERAYDALVALVDPLMNVIPVETNLELRASSPGGVPDVQALPEEAASLVRDRVLPALSKLDAAIALERSPEDAVWETLVLEGHGHSGKAWIGVVNAIGRRERVTTFGTAKGLGPYIAGWSAARSDSADLGSSWDVARRGRRVVDYGGEASLVDRGANRICDILGTLDRKVFTSCEGHPWGAYVGFRPGADVDLAEGFAAAGWSLESEGTIARMPEVRSTQERDGAWRILCTALERRYGLIVKKTVLGCRDGERGDRERV